MRVQEREGERLKMSKGKIVKEKIYYRKGRVTINGGSDDVE